MKNVKNDIVRFLVWMRNGISFGTTWFLLILLAYNYMFDIQTISTMNLLKMFLWVCGGVFIFCTFFSSLFIKKWGFLSRLTGFMVTICLYECVGFYSIGIFAGKGSIVGWIIFVGIVLVLYLICIFIYKQYSKKQGEIYTQALRKYQKQRSIKDGK